MTANKFPREIATCVATIILSSSPLSAGDLLQQLQTEVATLVDQARRDVVTITVPYPSNQESVRSVLITSGLIIADSLVVTAASVVAQSETVEVTTSTDHQVSAAVAGVDSAGGIALLKLTHPLIGSFTPTPGVLPEVGDWTFLITTRFEDLAGYSPGIVTAVRPAGMNGQVTTEIQASTPPLPASAGAILVDVYGRVIGLVVGRPGWGEPIDPTEDATMPGVLAVPFDEVLSVATELVNTGRVKRSWLGISVQAMTPALRTILGVEPGIGAIVVHVENGGPAHRAGLEMGDVILSCGEHPVDSPGGLMRAVSCVGPGAALEFNILRNDAVFVLPVTLTELPHRGAPADEAIRYENDPEEQIKALERQLATLKRSMDRAPKE